MTIKTYSLMAIMTLCSADYANAQRVSYNHDSSKQNQITVMETGAGSLSPELYYMAKHYQQLSVVEKEKERAKKSNINSLNIVIYLLFVLSPLFCLLSCACL